MRACGSFRDWMVHDHLQMTMALLDVEESRLWMDREWKDRLNFDEENPLEREEECGLEDEEMLILLQTPFLIDYTAKVMYVVQRVAGKRSARRNNEYERWFQRTVSMGEW